MISGRFSKHSPQVCFEFGMLRENVSNIEYKGALVTPDCAHAYLLFVQHLMAFSSFVKCKSGPD
jgi:hypothetical protein